MVEQKFNSGMPVIANLEDFDKNSGGWFERVIFRHRMVVVVACLLATVVLGFFATRLQVNASFEKMIPSSSPYIKNYLAYKDQLPGLGNSIRVVVENKTGDIYDADYLLALQKVNDDLYMIDGVDRSWMKSIWMPIVRWREVTEDGITGGPVMPAQFDGSPGEVAKLRDNVAKAGIVGRLVALDMKSSMIVVPLLDSDPKTGQPLDYGVFSRKLEEKIRSYESAKVGIHIVGFAKIVGDLIDGLKSVMLFFAVSVAVATLFVYLYTRCVRSTVLLVSAAVIGVVWLLGLMQLLGYELDPYSILVPFLIFAIGLSHGAQKMNGIIQDIGRGTHKYVAARYTFRRLFVAGVTALLANIVGFAVLIIIDIPVIRDLAITTSIGVSVLVFTKLFLIPVALSYIGIGAKAAQRALESDRDMAEGQSALGRVWGRLDGLTGRRMAIGMTAVALVVSAVSAIAMQGLRIGDLDAGAPELRPDSRYNRDNAYITRHYGLSSDQFVVIMKTDDEGCRLYSALTKMDGLAQLRARPGGAGHHIAGRTVRFITAAMSEGSSKWMSISRNQSITDGAMSAAAIATPDITNQSCSVSPLVVYLSDHKADTVARILKTSSQFAQANNTPAGAKEPVAFLLAAGSAGIEAATNIEVGKSIMMMYLAVYGSTALLVPDHLPQLARHRGRPDPAADHHDPVQGADGLARDRPEGGDAAGDRGRGGGRRRLRALPAVGAAGLPAPRRQPARGLPPFARLHRQGGGPGGHDDGGRRRDLGLVADQVSGRHGHPADLHVLVEHARCAGAHAGALLLPAQSPPRPG
jgi:predicted RND superfamily exporter protein